ncbi:MAG TPA: DinB family protein [Thermoanaerobaculia bacterium]|nr:DinB family protein [Thermoanaerobaculia bacterium]
MTALADLEQELDEAAERARRLVESTEPRLFTVRPDLWSWSASECMAHLSLSSEMFIPLLRGAIDEARRRGVTGEEPPSMDLLGRILRWFMEPPVRKRLKTSAPFVPKGVRAKAEALGEFMALQRRLVELVRSAEGIALSRVKVVSPFDKRARYNVYSAFRIITAHQRRHLWQAEQAVAALRAA